MKIKLNELDRYAKDLIASLKEEASPGKATVLALNGNLGAGKTTLTQYISRALGIITIVTSSTFTIEKIYELKNQDPFKKLIHIDAYRLENPNELENLGWDEIINEAGNLIVVEWANNVQDILPPNTKTLNLSYVDEEVREIV